MLTTGPPPAAPTHSVPTVPEIHLLTAAIIKSTDRLLVVSHSIGANDACEWRLAWVAFTASVSVYPSCTLDGWFLFEFYICNPADWPYNAVNQRYWIQCHGWEDITHPTLSTKTHLVCPSDMSEDYARRHNILPFWKWLNITHLDTYIHVPFEFISAHGRKRRDRISQEDWNILQRHVSMFQNPIPKFYVPTYSIHVDRGAHVTYHDQAHTDILCFEASRTSDSAHDRRYPWQKVLEHPIASPHFFFFKHPPGTNNIVKTVTILSHWVLGILWCRWCVFFLSWSWVLAAY